MVAEGHFIQMNTAFMLLAYLGMTHLEVLSGDNWCSELYYWSFFDVKLGYARHAKKYYLKSYPRDPNANIDSLLKYVREFRRRHHYRFVPNHRQAEYRWYKAHTDRFGAWKEVPNDKHERALPRGP